LADGSRPIIPPQKGNVETSKGGVERIHGAHQDRLIKKLRRKKIDSSEAANQYLEKEYLPEHNRRFARSAAVLVSQ
jgi:hypothetical protein